VAFYYRLGELGRSPIWTPQDIQSHYFELVFKYGVATIGIGALTAGAVYYFTKKD
jgi:hypothetical protein